MEDQICYFFLYKMYCFSHNVVFFSMLLFYKFFICFIIYRYFNPLFISLIICYILLFLYYTDVFFYQ